MFEGCFIYGTLREEEVEAQHQCEHVEESLGREQELSRAIWYIKKYLISYLEVVIGKEKKGEGASMWFNWGIYRTKKANKLVKIIIINSLYQIQNEKTKKQSKVV